MIKFVKMNIDERALDTATNEYHTDEAYLIMSEESVNLLKYLSGYYRPSKDTVYYDGIRVLIDNDIPVGYFEVARVDQ